MSVRLRTAFSCLAGIVCFAAPVSPQSVGEQLSVLLTEQGPAPAGFVRDEAAAEATFATVAGLLQVELTALPATSSSGGFVYRLNPTLGTIERATMSFGPFFTERAIRSSARQLAVGMTYQMSSFGSLQGAALETGTFPTNAARFSGALNPISVDTLRLSLETRSVTGFAHYGVSDQLDIGVLVPIVNLTFSGTRVSSFDGEPTFTISEHGSASGLGDISVTARYRLGGHDGWSWALGSDLRLPTGREDDLLGAGQAAVRGLVIASWDVGRVSAHLNGGIGAGGASEEISYGGAVTYAVRPRLTLVGELLARRYADLYRVVDVYQPHPVLAGIETMRWLPDEGGVTNAYSVAGIKWNVSGSMVLNSSVLVRLTDAGLRARVTPTFSIDYAFDR